jgi:hypothetical protein
MLDKQPFIPGLEPARDSLPDPRQFPRKPKGWAVTRLASLESRILSLELEIILLRAQLGIDEDDD